MWRLIEDRAGVSFGARMLNAIVDLILRRTNDQSAYDT